MASRGGLTCPIFGRFVRRLFVFLIVAVAFEVLQSRLVDLAGLLDGGFGILLGQPPAVRWDSGLVCESPFGLNIAYTQAAVGMALLFVTLPFVARAVQPVLLELDRNMEEASTSLGASGFQTFRRIILPNLLPAILSGAALSFARCVGEFGSVVLITGNIPFDTQVASVYIFGQIESDNVTGAAAVSVLLLAISLLVLFGIGLINRWGTRHDR